MRRFFLIICLLLVAGRVDAANLEIVPAPYFDLTKLVYTYNSAEKNVVYIVNHDWGGAFFEMNLFEDIWVQGMSGPSPYARGRNVNDEAFTWTRQGDGWVTHISQFLVVDFECTMTLRVELNTVVVDGIIANNSFTDWTPDLAYAHLCYRARHAAGFDDRKGERVFVRLTATGQRTSVKDYFGEGNYLGPGSNFWVGLGTMFEPVIERENSGHTRFIRASTAPRGAVMGNREQVINCIHPNLGLSVKAGQTMTFRSMMTLYELTGCGEWVLYR